MEWDKKRALEELGIPEGFYLQLVEGFVNQSEAAILDLEKAFLERNFEKVAKAAHYIKGAAGNLRIEEIHVTAKELESVAKASKNIGTIEEQLKCLKGLLKSLKDLMEE